MLQERALEILKTGATVFLTGEPGSGKTHTINEYVAWLRRHGIEPAIAASTGIAATHIHGMTIHSWSGIGVMDRMTPEALDAIASKEHVVKRIQKTPVLIIDEISMLSGTVLDMVDQVAREVRHRTEPFGGMQVVLVGDFFQLPPISRSREPVPFAFESRVWKQMNPLMAYLTEQHRQDDQAFLSILAAIRNGSEEEAAFEGLMERQIPEKEVSEDTPRLYTHNADVDRLNADKLAKLTGKGKTYTMTREGSSVLADAIVRGCLSPEKLELREGAIVMCTKNNPAAGYANGTLGTVIDFQPGTGWPVIETKSGREIVIAPSEWAVEENGKVRAKVTQVPLRLAWAITVHKSQGMSMDAAAMDLGRAFEYGQGYVALSRVRTLSGISLMGWSNRALAMHPTVSAIDKAFREASEIADAAFHELGESGERSKMEENFIRAAGGTVAEVALDDSGKTMKATTYDVTHDLVKAELSLEDIAKERSLTPGTICDHLEKLAEAGRLTKDELRSLAPEHVLSGLTNIRKAFGSAGGDEKLAPAFGKLAGEYSYDELKLARVLIRAGA